MQDTTASTGADIRSGQARGRARRQAILEAALEQFARTGFRGTSLAAVAAAVGISDAGLLYHFRTKEDLLIGVLGYHDQVESDRLRGLPGLTDIEVIRQLGTWGQMMEQEPSFMALHVVLSAEHLRDDSVANRYFRQRYKRLLGVLTALMENAQASGEIGEDVDPAWEASSFIAFLDGLRLQWFFGDGQVSLATSVRNYVEDLLARLGASRTTLS
jgi:AcrR family transcriptional regulator